MRPRLSLLLYRSVNNKNPPLSVRDLKFLAGALIIYKISRKVWVRGSYYLQNFDPVLDHFLTVSPFKSAKKVQFFSACGRLISQFLTFRSYYLQNFQNS